MSEPDLWIFRAACILKGPKVVYNRLRFGLILDLGFNIYREIDCQLADVAICSTLAQPFADSWCLNGVPNPLKIQTMSNGGSVILVHVERTELSLETLEPIGLTSLADALIEQGLAEKM